MFRENPILISGTVLLFSLYPGYALCAVPSDSSTQSVVDVGPSATALGQPMAEFTQNQRNAAIGSLDEPQPTLQNAPRRSLDPQVAERFDRRKASGSESHPDLQNQLAQLEQPSPQKSPTLLPELVARQSEAVTLFAAPPLLQQDDISAILAQVNTRPSNPRQDRFQQPPLELPPTESNESNSDAVQVEGEGTPESPALPSDSSGPSFPVSKIQVRGSTVFDADDLDPITQKAEGRNVTVEDLRRVADEITQLYLDKGYITSRAVLVDQPITDGTVQIQAIEGRLSEIKVEGNRRLSSGYIRRRVRLGAKPPLRADRLEDQLRLLRADPLFKNVEASLRSGGKIGESILIVRVTESRPFIGSFGVDNYSPPSVGSERLVLAAAVRNVTGIGDTFDVSHKRSVTGGSIIYDISYRAPLNPMNGTLQLRGIVDRNKVTQEPFDILNIRGETERYEISFRQPLVRTPREEFALSLGFSFKDGQTFIFDDPIPTPFGIGPDEDGVSRTSVFRFGQDYVKRDSQGAWALRSQFNFGVGLLDATINDAPIPDSRFFSWLGQIQRVQRTDSSQLLIVQADIQLTPHTLLPSEQFVIGGGQSLRGYRQNARSADNGFRFSIEDRITLERNEAGASVLQIAPFFDMGMVWNHPRNPNTVADQRFLAGVGLGLLWEPIPNLNLRLDYAVPFIDLDDRGENAQDDGFTFSANYRF